MIFQTTFVIVASLLHFSKCAFDLENNACSNILDYPLAPLSGSCHYDPNVLPDVPSIVIRNGYNIQEFPVTTPDGYILTVFRIYLGVVSNGTPIFLQHDFEKDSSYWFYRNKEYSLAFSLVDLGYDVWVGNFRGSTYSTKHVSLKISDYKYWNWGLDEVAEFDISTQLELVANNTGKAGSIVFIVHGAATSVGFMFASAYPEKSQKFLSRYVAISPAVYQNSTVIKRLTPVLTLAHDIGLKGTFYQPIWHKIFLLFCRILPGVYQWLMFYLFGNSVQYSPDTLLLFFSTWPGAINFFVSYQYVQIAAANRFQKYDYGSEENLKRYNSTQPPVDDLGKITIPVNLYCGKRDTSCSVENSNRIIDELGSTEKTLSAVPKNNDEYAFNRLDYFLSNNVREFFFEDLFSVLAN